MRVWFDVSICYEICVAWNKDENECPLSKFIWTAQSVTERIRTSVA